jgi:hypothetical protein
MLRALGVNIDALQEKCPPSISDVALFQYLAGSDYVFISEDRRQLTRIAEASQLRSAGISAMYFGPFWSGLRFWKQAEYLVRHWETFDALQRGLVAGTILELKQNGKSMVLP